MSTSHSEGRQSQVPVAGWSQILTGLLGVAVLGLGGWTFIAGTPQSISKVWNELRVHWSAFDLVQGRVVEWRADHATGGHIPLVTVEYLQGNQPVRHEFAPEGRHTYTTEARALAAASTGFPADSQHWVYVNSHNPREAFLREQLAKSTVDLVLAIAFGGVTLACLLSLIMRLMERRMARLISTSALQGDEPTSSDETDLPTRSALPTPRSSAVEIEPNVPGLEIKTRIYLLLAISICFLFTFAICLIVVVGTVEMAAISYEDDVPTHWTNRPELTITLIVAAMIVAAWYTARKLKKSKAATPSSLANT